MKDVITRDEIACAVADEEWQAFRASLHFLTTEQKLAHLAGWLKAHDDSRKAIVQVTNYKNALRRAGLLPPS